MKKQYSRTCAASDPLDGTKLAEAAWMMFGSREEMRKTFREWETALVETIHAACERARLREPMDDSDPQVSDAVACEAGLGSRETDSEGQ